MRVWYLCHGHIHSRMLKHHPWRVVEAQHLSSSRDLVESREEHDLLEEMLEVIKPKVATLTHYLIFTAFRYPPLKHGSRFARTYETSLWYGSLELETAMAEVAYYRLKFFADTTANLGYVEIPMTAFQAQVQTAQGIDLTNEPFNAYRQQICDQYDYQYSQELGSDMRSAGIDAFIFFSARSLNQGKNIGVFRIEAFSKKNHEYVFNMQNWRCLANQGLIEFSRIDLDRKLFFNYSKSDFFHELDQHGGCILA